MKQLIAVLKKEVRDNLRDRRSVFFALLYGPLLLPLMMVGPMAMGISKYAINFDQLQVVHMVAPDRSPNMVQFLLEKNIAVEAVDDEFRSRIKNQDLALVIELASNYERALREGKIAVIRLYYNKNNDDSAKVFRKTSVALAEYSRSLAAARLDIRGLGTAFLMPIRVMEQDIGGADDAGKIVATIVPFILVLSLTMGGFYLAVDSTAGERERHSLEPLLSLSISRFSLVLGKLLALMSFVALSGALAVSSTYLLFAFIPVEALTTFLQVEIGVFARVFLLCLPLVPFFTTAMMLIATYARDTKEAQTHLGLAMMVPMAPFFIMQFANVQNMDVLTWVPVMSQFLLIEQLVIGEPLSWTDLSRSIAGALCCALLFLMLILTLYRKEKILGV